MTQSSSISLPQGAHGGRHRPHILIRAISGIASDIVALLSPLAYCLQYLGLCVSTPLPTRRVHTSHSGENVGIHTCRYAGFEIAISPMSLIAKSPSLPVAIPCPPPTPPPTPTPPSHEQLPRPPVKAFIDESSRDRRAPSFSTLRRERLFRRVTSVPST